MNLVVNYSEEVKSLLEEGKIDFIDYLKLFSVNGDLSPFDWCIQNRKVMFHGFVGKGGSSIVEKEFLEDRDFNLQDDYFKRSGTPYISMHISIGKERDHMLTADDEEILIETVKDNLKVLRKKYDYDILLENVPVKPGDENVFLISRPEFITRVIRETNTYFLLDVAHARAAADTLGIDIYDYINALPLEKLREVHLSGCTRDSQGVLRANHTYMGEEDYEILDYLLYKCNTIEYITLEYSPYEPDTGASILEYGKMNEKCKKEVYDNLLKLKEVLNK